MIERFAADMAPYATGLAQQLAQQFWRIVSAGEGGEGGGDDGNEGGDEGAGGQGCSARASWACCRRRRAPAVGGGGGGRRAARGASRALPVHSLRPAVHVGPPPTTTHLPTCPPTRLPPPPPPSAGALAAYGVLRAMGTVLESIHALPHLYAQASAGAGLRPPSPSPLSPLPSPPARPSPLCGATRHSRPPLSFSPASLPPPTRGLLLPHQPHQPHHHPAPPAHHIPLHALPPPPAHYTPFLTTHLSTCPPPTPTDGGHPVAHPGPLHVQRGAGHL